MANHEIVTSLNVYQKKEKYWVSADTVRLNYLLFISLSRFTTLSDLEEISIEKSKQNKLLRFYLDRKPTQKVEEQLILDIDVRHEGEWFVFTIPLQSKTTKGETSSVEVSLHEESELELLFSKVIFSCLKQDPRYSCVQIDFAGSSS